MGRPLKIKHTTTVDIGYPNFASMDSPTQAIPTGMTSTEYLGVVGGGYPSGVATATYPTVECTAFFADGVDEQDAFIITQKGATKYLLAADNTISAGSFTVGLSYIIRAAGDTDWVAAGAAVNAGVGDVFTATTVGAGTGTVSSVEVCSLVNVAAASLTTVGQMQITVTVDGTAFQASRLTNKYVWDYATPRVKYAANFFEGAAAVVTTAASGAQADTWTNGTGTYDLAQVTDYTA